MTKSVISLLFILFSRRTVSDDADRRHFRNSDSEGWWSWNSSAR